MRYLLYYYFFRLFFGNPLLAIIIVGLIYFMVDRRFIGIMPDVFKPIKRKGRIKSLQEVIKVNPANVDAYKELGVLYLEEKKYQLAAQYLEKTLDKMGHYADVHFYLGKAYYLHGRIDEGTKELEKAIEINSKVGYGEPYVYLLNAELNASNNQEKINEIINSLERFGTPEILYKAGKVLKPYNQERAATMFTEAVDTYKISPKHFRKIHRRWALLARFNLLTK